MTTLENRLKKLVQRTSASRGNIASQKEREFFLRSIKEDIAGIIVQLNEVSYPLFDSLAKGNPEESLELGLSGNIIYTDVNAGPSSSEVYFHSGSGRPKTIKESLDYLISAITRIENSNTESGEVLEYDDSSLVSSINLVATNLQQLIKDTHGPNYSLTGDSNGVLSHSLSRHIDAIGSLFTGFPGTGNTYSGAYPSLSFSVNLSEINVDTTLPESAITGLSTNLNNIRSFIGQGSASDTAPDYTQYGPTNVLDGNESLDEAIFKLDQAVIEGSGSSDSLQTAWNTGNQIVIPPGSNKPVSIISNDNNGLAALSIVQNFSKSGLNIKSSSTSNIYPAINVDLESGSTWGYQSISDSGASSLRLHNSRVSNIESHSGTMLHARRKRFASEITDALCVLIQDEVGDDKASIRISQVNKSGKAIEIDGGSIETNSFVDANSYYSDYLGTPPTNSSQKGVFWSSNTDEPMWTDENGTSHSLIEVKPHSSTHLLSGSDEIDGDHIGIDFVPTHYTRDDQISEASDLKHLAAHLKGIDAAIGAGGGGGGGVPALNAVLDIGNTTQGSDLVISDGDSIVSENGPNLDDPGSDLRIKSGDGDGIGFAGNMVLQTGEPGATSLSENRGFFEFNIFSPNNSIAGFDVNIDDWVGIRKGMRVGEVWIGEDEDGYPSIRHIDQANLSDKSKIVFRNNSIAILASSSEKVAFGTEGSIFFEIDSVSMRMRPQALGSPAAGRLIFDSSTNKLHSYENGSWNRLRIFEYDNGTVNNGGGDIATDDFVFGSESLYGDSEFKMSFDKSKRHFRAGTWPSAWSSINAGLDSISLGYHNRSGSEKSSVLGGTLNLVGSGSTSSSIVSGEENGVEDSLSSSIVSGKGNEVEGSSYSSIVSGCYSHIVSSNYSFIGGGGRNNALAEGNSIMGPGGSSSSIVGGYLSIIDCVADISSQGEVPIADEGILTETLRNAHFIGGGSENLIVNTSGGEINAIVSGHQCSIEEDVNICQFDFIGNGFDNSIKGSKYSSIVNGKECSIIDSSHHSTILNGRNISVEADRILVLNGENQNPIIKKSVHVGWNKKSWSSEVIFSGPVDGDSGTYVLSLDDLSAPTSSLAAVTPISIPISRGGAYFLTATCSFVGRVGSSFLHGGAKSYVSFVIVENTSFTVGNIVENQDLFNEYSSLFELSFESTLSGSECLIAPSIIIPDVSLIGEGFATVKVNIVHSSTGS